MARVSRTHAIGRIAVGSFIGTAIEFYDFYIYGTATALVLNATIFPTLAPVNATLATFAVAFIGRPLDSLLLPGYATLGVAAPVILVLLRFPQGIGLGGEWGAAALLAVENAPAGRRSWYATFPQLGSSIGFFAANGLFLALSASLSDEAFRSWGWQIPFRASAAPVTVGLLVRLRLSNTPARAEPVAAAGHVAQGAAAAAARRRHDHNLLRRLALGLAAVCSAARSPRPSQRRWPPQTGRPPSAGTSRARPR